VNKQTGESRKRAGDNPIQVMLLDVEFPHDSGLFSKNKTPEQSTAAMLKHTFV
jgi:hypothetical protein